MASGEYRLLVYNFPSQVLEKMLKYDIPSEQLFNVFFAFTTKYIPKETGPQSEIYFLFHLILQYHDPEVR